MTIRNHLRLVDNNKNNKSASWLIVVLAAVGAIGVLSSQNQVSVVKWYSEDGGGGAGAGSGVSTITTTKNHQTLVDHATTTNSSNSSVGGNGNGGNFRHTTNATTSAITYDEETSLSSRTTPHSSNNTDNSSISNTIKKDLKVMIYITTHMSSQHIWYLKACWPPALQHSILLNTSDVVVYLNPPLDGEREEAHTILQDTFRNQQQNHRLTIHDRPNPGYQEGAKAAMADAMKEGWFRGYDWIIRVNADVIIRDDSFLLHTMQNDPNATAMLLNCISSNVRPVVHTDFLAIKPEALPPDTFLEKTNTDPNAERAFTNDIREAILDKGNHRWVPNSSPRFNSCRAGHKRGMDETHITHFHQDEHLLQNFLHCPIPFLK